jgi:hypothetical protein
MFAFDSLLTQYEGMNITGATGLTVTQKQALKDLGAIKN